MCRFGEVRHYKDGETLFETGKPGPGMFVILSGHVAITQRDGLGHITPVIDQSPGQFLAEIVGDQHHGHVALTLLFTPLFRRGHVVNGRRLRKVRSSSRYAPSPAIFAA